MSQAKELTTFNRPLRLRLDLSSGQSDRLLLPQRVFGTETICGGIEYRVLCVSEEVDLQLKHMIAVAATLEFVTDTGELRSVCGIVTEASSGDSDGGLASYQLVLRDALSIMEKRTNTRVFRTMNEVQIVRQILNEWCLGSPLLGICFDYETDQAFEQHSYPQREFTMQHNESDADFIRRLLKRRGIGWYFRATPKEAYSLHTLVLFNSPDSLHQNAAGEIRYHRDAATEQRDTITSWSAVRSLRPGTVTRHSWDHMNPAGTQFMAAHTRSGSNQGARGNELAASLDDYQVMMPHAGINNEDLLNLGQLHMSRHDYESKCFHGEGSVRDLCAGEYFTLSGHPEIDSHPDEERDFVVTALSVTAQNNLPKALAARVESLFARSQWMMDARPLPAVSDQTANGPLRVHIQFTAVRRGIDIVPAYDARIDLPQVSMQSAIVVGSAGQEVHCDSLGRVKIRFPGTRPQDHEHAHGAGASDGEYDSAWVRVASNWAGNGGGSVQQCGTVGLPRVGSEVLVAFLGGDPDKPVIVGQLYNQLALPPALSKQGDLPGNRHLSGIKSREVGGGRANQLRFDESTGEISAQLASEHGQSQLNLGFLTQPRIAGEGESRGEGAELRSDLTVAVRGAEGVLITAQAGEAEKGKQLERSELTRIAGSLLKLAEQLSKMTEKFAQDAPHGKELGQLVEKIRQLDTEGEPVIAIDGPAGVLIGSGQSLLLGAAGTLDIASGGDGYISTGGKAFLSSATSMSLFANQGDMKLNTAGGKVQLQAQNDAMGLLAKKVLDIISTTDWINISARQGVRINGGGTELVLSADGIKGYTGGKHEMHAADHQTMGASSKPVKFAGSTVCPSQMDGAQHSGDATQPRN
ncbi:type VI secretion system tip protein VgrG [Oxalobacteraceae bacterium]|nr:type VI secretion system tip protein VgrG [Oxalobacteraceae bacterium]